MRLKLRTASAKVLLAAAALAVLAATPAFSAAPGSSDPCAVDGASVEISPPSSYVEVPNDSDFDVNGIFDTGIEFVPQAGATHPAIVVENHATINAVSGEPGMAIADQYSSAEELGSVCYNGASDAEINSAGTGLEIRKLGDGSVSANVAHDITAGETAIDIEHWASAGSVSVTTAGVLTAGRGGISILRGGDGDVTVATGGDINAADFGVNVERSGDVGDISITTASGMMIEARGGIGFDETTYAPGMPIVSPIGGSMGIRAVRSGGKGNISIINSAEIAADFVGIHAQLCGCDEGDISIVSTGDIVIAGVHSAYSGGRNAINGVGIGALSAASGNVTVNSSGDITAPDFGIYASHDGDAGDIWIGTATNTTIRAQGGDGGTSTVTGISAFRGGGASLSTGSLTIINGAHIISDGNGIEASIEPGSTLGDTMAGTLSIVSTGEIEAGSTGIDAYHGGDGDLTIATSADITAVDAGIIAEHDGLTGDILITTGPRTTIVAQNGGAPIIASFSNLGPTGIYAFREDGMSGNIGILNDANILADSIGIYANICGCSQNGTINIVNSADITAAGVMAYDPFNIMLPAIGPIGAGIYAANDGDVSVRLTDGTITGPAGIYVFADHANLEIGSSAVIHSTGTFPIFSGGVLLNTASGADVTVAGNIDALSDAILFGAGDNTLTLVPGFSITGFVFGGYGGTQTLRLGGNGGFASFDLDLIDSQYLFFDSLRKSGSSTWTLVDSGAFSSAAFGSPITADAGKLIVDTAIPGLEIDLTGTGAIGGNGSFAGLTATGGILAPGHSPGTLTVGTANLAGVVYQVDTRANGESDLLNVTGIATIDPSSTVLAQPEAGAYAKTTTYTILTANQLTVGSAFGSASSASPYFDVALSQDLTNIYLTLTRKALGSVVAGLTPNQKSTAAGLDSFAGPAPYFDKLMQLPTAQLPAALSALSGDGYASLITALITDQRYLRDAAFERLTAARFTPGPVGATGYGADADAPVPTGTKVWGRAYGGLSTLIGDGNGPGVNHGVGGIVAGADAEFGNTRLGLLAAGGITGFAIPDRAMTATSGDFSLGGYGDANWDNFYLSFGATFTGHSIATTRTAAFAGVSDVYTAQYGALTSQAFGEIGYRVDLGASKLTPFASLALVNNMSAGYSEAGSGPGKLTVAPGSTSAAIATLGLRLEHQLVLNDDMLVTLSGSAAWRHVIGGMGATTNAFAGSTPFTVLGAPAAIDSILLTAGADFNVSDDLSLGLAYSGAIGNGGAHALTGTLTGHF